MARRRAILYARVSTRDKQHPEAQIEQLREWAEREDDLQVIDEITDKVSGGSIQRPGLDRARELIRFRRADILAATALDRISQSVQHLLELRAELLAKRCDLVMLREQIDTRSAHGLYAFQVLGAGAELQRSLIRQSVSDGVRRAQRRGKKVGRIRRMPMSVVLSASALRQQGLSWGQVRTRLQDQGLGTWKRGTISRGVGRLLIADNQQGRDDHG
jgi:DNA invertase Pin-like site-specific DNA recombinase